MSKLKKNSIIVIIIIALAYAFGIGPDGSFLVPVAELIKRKAETTEDSRIHSLDLEKYRTSQPFEK